MRPRLEKWSVFQFYDSTKRATGIISGDKRFQDGRRVFTSPVLEGPTLTEGVMTIRTETGTVYELGEPA